MVATLSSFIPGPAHVSVEEAAQELRLSNRTVRRWVHSGAVPARRYGAGGKLWMERRHLVAFLETRERSIKPVAEKDRKRLSSRRARRKSGS